MNRYVTIPYMYEVENGYVQGCGVDIDDADFTCVRDAYAGSAADDGRQRVTQCSA